MTNHIDIDEGPDTEQYDEIPWSDLVDDLSRPRYSTPLLVAGVLVVGGLIGFVVGGLGEDTAPASEIIAPAPPPSALPAPVAPAAPGSQTTTTVTAAVFTPEMAFSEADLMAVADEEEIRTASVRAEWFVREFFTMDGGVAGDGNVASVLDAYGLDRVAAGTTYVEWAGATIVEPARPGSYAVTVAFQTLAQDGDRFVRAPARAVTVDVAVTPDLASSVTGLPRPALLNAAPIPSPSIDDDPPPQSIVDTATAAAARFGEAPELRRSWFEEGTWHIVMSVQFAGGMWPVQIDVPA